MWVAQLVEQMTLDFGSGHDLMVHGTKPCIGKALSMELAWDSLSSSLSAPPLLSLSLSKLTSKLLKKFN